MQPVLSSGGKRRVSTSGGTQPHWGRDGSELFYVASDQKLMTVPVRVAPSFEPGTPKALFQLRTI